MHFVWCLASYISIINFIKNFMIFYRPPGCPDSFYETICLCHQANAKNRPSFAALLVWAKQHASSHDDN